MSRSESQHFILFSSADIPVTLLPSNPPPFPSFLTSPLFINQISSNIIVTDEMEELYSLVKDGNEKSPICLFGGPGCGKTTTLVWLYCQLLHFTEMVPVVGNVDRVLTFSKNITKNSVLLMDLSDPTILDKRLLFELLELFIRFHAVVLAVSSGFKSRLRSTLLNNSFNQIFICAQAIQCRPFTNSLATTFLMNLRENLSKEDVTGLIQLTKGVPRLLSHAFSKDFKERISALIKSEFECAMACMPISITTGVDVKILLACYFNLPLVLVRVSLVQAEMSSLLDDNLVYVERKDVNAIPCSYFKLTRELIEVVTQSLWIPYTDLLNLLEFKFS